MSKKFSTILCSLLFVVQSANAQVDLNKVLAEGLSAYAAGKYADAVTSFRQIYDAQKENTPESVLYSLGFAYYKQLQFQDAADIFNVHAKKYPGVSNAGEVQLFLGKALLDTKDDAKVDEAIAALGRASKFPDFAEDARFAAADAYIKKGDTAKAQEILKQSTRERSAGPAVMTAYLKLVDLFIEGDKLEDAVDILKQVQATSGYPDVIGAVNYRLMQIGDKYLDVKNYRQSLSAYSAVKERRVVLEIQKERIERFKKAKETLEKKVAATKKAGAAASRVLDDKLQLYTTMVDHLSKVTKELEAKTDYDAVLYFRIARCYFNMERYWYSASGFERVITEYPDFADAEGCVFGSLVSHFRLGLTDEVSSLSEKYISKYPTGKFFEQAAEINATNLYNKGKKKETVEFITDFVAKHPDLANKEKFQAMAANANFQDGKYDDAAKQFDELIKSNPANIEEFTYYRALCDFLRNDYVNTVKSFDNYEKNYPSGSYITDIQYRRGIILLALAAQESDPEKKKKLYAKLDQSMQDLLANEGSKPFRGQVYTLLADSQIAQGLTSDAATNYAMAVKNANGDDNVISYALEEATNSLRGNRRWDELKSLWEVFLKDNPGHAMELRGISELAKLYVRSNEVDKAKASMLQYVLRDIHNVRSEYVEMLLSQYTALYIPKKQAVKKPKPGEEAAPVPVVKTPEQSLSELMQALEIPDADRSLPYAARMLFVKSEFYRMIRDTKSYENTLDTLSTSSKPEDLSPMVLAIVGQHLLDKGNVDAAAPFFTYLRDTYPDSPYSEAGPIGLGEIALLKKDWSTALASYDQALAKTSGSMVKEATFGKAKALYGLGNFEEAKKLFNEILGTKEWRGKEKPGSLFYLGEIAAKDKEYAKANGYYTKIYTSYQAYPDYAAKSYIRSADMLKSNGQFDEADRTLKELANHAKLKDTPEAKQAASKIN